MLRRLTFLIASAAPLFGQAHDFDYFVSLLTEADSPFRRVDTKIDNGGLEQVYERLLGITGGVFEDGGRGVLIYERSPWKTGESRLIAARSGAAPVVLVSMRQATATETAFATFRVQDSGVDIEVPIRGIGSMAIGDSADRLSGWMLGDGLAVVIGHFQSPFAKVRYSGLNSRSTVIASNREIGAVFLKTDASFVPRIPVANTFDPSETVRISTLDGRSFVAPGELVYAPPAAEVLGALVTDMQGALIGLLSEQGLVPGNRLVPWTLAPDNSTERLLTQDRLITALGTESP